MANATRRREAAARAPQAIARTRQPVSLPLLVGLALVMTLIALLLVAVPAKAAPSKADALQVQASLMCQCGCNQTVKDCPHPNCEFAVPARQTIDDDIAKGMSSSEIINTFLVKYGPTVLPVPVKSGFSLIAWVMPFVGLLVAAVAVFFIIRSWGRRRQLVPVTVDGEQGDVEAPDEVKRRLDDELKKFD